MSFLPDDEQELREIAEAGREYEIAKEVFTQFIADWRNGLIDRIETEELSNEQLQILATQLRAIKDFWYVCTGKINQAKLARKELIKNGK